MKNIWQIKSKKIGEGPQIFKKIGCPYKQNPVIRVCCTKRCNKSALMCNGQNCQQCYKSHSNCEQFINFQSIDKKLKKNSFELFGDVLKFYLDIIKTAVKQYNELLGIIPSYQFCSKFQRFTLDLYKNSQSIKSKDISNIQQDLRGGLTQIQIEKSKLFEKINLGKYSTIIEELKQLRTSILQYKKSFSEQDSYKDESRHSKGNDQSALSEPENQPSDQNQIQDHREVQKQIPSDGKVCKAAQVQKEPDSNKQALKEQVEQNYKDGEQIKQSDQIKQQPVSIDQQLIAKQQQRPVKQQLNPFKQQSVDHKQQLIAQRQQYVKILSQKNSGKNESEKSMDFEQHINKVEKQLKKQLGVKMTESVQQAKHTDSVMIDKSGSIDENSAIQQASNYTENVLQSSSIYKSVTHNISNKLDKDQKPLQNKFLIQNYDPIQQKSKQSSPNEKEF